jgi:subtilase family serine protease
MSSRSRTLESLESRRLFSASLIDSVVAQPAELTLSPMVSNSTVVGLTPAQVKKAYGIDSISFNGIKGDGSGQTIAIVGAYNAPNIASDLKTFDKAFSLSDPPSFKKVSQAGSATSLPATDTGWAMELSLDVEWAHAVAPKANILLVEAKSASLGDLLKAVDYARNAGGVSVVSMSWGADEFWGQTSFDYHFTTPAGHQGVTFVAASGDDGSWYGPEWPSVSSNVLSVGGTNLSLSNSSGTYASERGWFGSGGGVSYFENEPGYQASVQSSGARTTPDVSYNADPNTGFAVYDSTAYQGYSGWEIIGGTSAGAPQWAGLIAIANQGRSLAGKSSLNGVTQTLPTLYSMRTTGFHDITSGWSSYWVSAYSGYDLVSGLGTPRAATIVQGLKNAGSASSSAAAKTATTVATAKTTSTAKAAALAQRATQMTPTLPVQTPAQTLSVDHAQIVAAADLGGSGPSGGQSLSSASRTGHAADLPAVTVQAGLFDHLGISSSNSSATGSAGAARPLQLANVRSTQITQTPSASHSVSRDRSLTPASIATAPASVDAAFGLVPLDDLGTGLSRERRDLLTALAAGAAVVLTQVYRFGRRRRKGLAVPWSRD